MNKLNAARRVSYNRVTSESAGCYRHLTWFCTGAGGHTTAADEVSCREMIPEKNRIPVLSIRN